MDGWSASKPALPPACAGEEGGTTSSWNKIKTCQRADELIWANGHCVHCYSQIAPVTAGNWFITRAKTRHNGGLRPAGCALVRGNHVLLAIPGCRSG